MPPKQKKLPIKKLTVKEELFIEYYLQSFNATKSAIWAGYSEKTATEIGYENLRKPHIAQVIDAKIEERKARIPKDLPIHLNNIANFNIADLLDENGEIDFEIIKQNKFPGLVQGVSITETPSKMGTKKNYSFKLADQLKAAEILSKILKLQETSINAVINNTTNIDISGAVSSAVDKLMEHTKNKK